MRSVDKQELSKLSGLFDYAGPDDLVIDLAAVTGLEKEEVLRKLVSEYYRTGSNVVADAKKIGLDYHIFNEKMEEFYKKTNAFLFELAVTHQSPLCRQIDEKIMKSLLELRGGRPNNKLLVLGDGIGSDSLRFSALGFDVTYFEFEGYSSALAKRRFARTNFQIKHISDLDRIPSNNFDFVVCREVLEHVSDPVAVIASINRYLTNNGYAIITESFERVEPDFPTHLQSNLKYAGKTVSMFVDSSFKFAGTIDDERPFIFQKSDADISGRRSSIPRRSVVALSLRKLAFTILRRFQ